MIDDALIVRRLILFAFCLYGGMLMFIDGLDSFYKGWRLLGAVLAFGGVLLGYIGLGLWWLNAFPETWGWPI